MPGSDDLAINVRRAGHRHAIDLSGVIDASTVDALRGVLIDLTDQGGARIEIDLAHVDLVDSTGIGALAEAYRRGADITLRNPSPVTMRQLVMSGVDRIFHVT